MGIRKPNCKVLRHEATIEITQPSASTFAYFVDLTENHYKAMINVNVQSPDGTPGNAQLIVTPRTGTPTTINFSGSATIQIEDARSVALTSPSSLGGSMNIIKDFCICCPDFGEVHRHEGTFSFRGGNYLFTDLTENHYKAMVVVNGTLGGEVNVTPRPGGDVPPPIPLPPSAQIAIQIEDAQALSITTRANDTPPNTVQIIKDFCISCP
jgi:hypothetical protein